MINFLCVLKSGGHYRLKHVKKLYDALKEYVDKYGWFAMLCDDPCAYLPGVETVELKHDLPAWWSKLELFNIKTPCIYFDLDTVITGDIDGLVRAVEENKNSIYLLRSFKRSIYMSGIMAWNGDYSFILNDFLKARTGRTFRNRSNAGGPEAIVNNRRYIGDQNWIQHALQSHGERIDAIQSVQSGIYSYKKSIAGLDRLPPGANIICFHGRPRPDELPAHHFLREYYDN